MKKLVVIALALMQVGTVVARPLKEELVFLTVQLHNLGEKFGLEAPPPPPPQSPSPDRPLTREELEWEREFAERHVPPPPVLVPGDVRPQPQPHSDSDPDEEFLSSLQTKPLGELNYPFFVEVRRVLKKIKLKSGLPAEVLANYGKILDNRLKEFEENLVSPPPHLLSKLPPLPGSGTVVKPVVKPVFEKSIKKEVYTPLWKTLLAAHEDGNLSAVIGITPEGSLVVYGPVLKDDKHDAAQFFQDGRQFMYPNTDHVRFVMDGGKAKAEYAVYELINMPELKAQKTFFDQIEQQIKQIQARRKDADDLDRAQAYVVDLHNLVAAVVAAYKNPILASAKLHGQLTKETVSAHSAEELVRKLHSLVEQIIVALETRLNKAAKEKTDQLAQWAKDGTPDNLLENRWRTAQGFDRIKNEFAKLTGLIAQLKAIDINQLVQISAQLGQQSPNKQKQDLDAYYATLHTTGQEPQASGVRRVDEEENEESQGLKLSEAEEVELENLKKEFIENATGWTSATLDPLVEGNVKAKLRRYAVLKKKEDTDWRPARKILGLFTFHKVEY